jgi:pyruvate kinase
VFLGLPEEADRAGDEVYVPLGVPEMLHGLDKGMSVYLSDGMLQFLVVEVVEPNRLFVLEAQNSGLLSSNKGIAFPGKYHAMPALTDKDRKDLHEALDIGVDALALSFVQERKDVEDLRKEIEAHGTWVPIVAKLERKNAVDNLEDILEVADVIMVARGDLGLECSLVTLPVIQKRILRACRHAQKAAIVATQMLLSMVKNPIPTRAETTDVANAVLDGADCLMLSEETAVGSHPVEVVRLLRGIANHSEEYYLERVQGPYAPRKHSSPAKFMAYAACLVAESMGSEALVAHSTSGLTSRFLSSRRPAQPIYALTPKPAVVRHMNFFWGVQPRLVETAIKSHDERAADFVQNCPDFSHGRSVVLTAGQPTPGQETMYTNTIKVYHK